MVIRHSFQRLFQHWQSTSIFKAFTSVRQVARSDAMGTSTRQRGFTDPNLFVATTTQEKVAGVSLEHCQGRGRDKTCQTVSQKVSYAIPLEIIYMTPLNRYMHDTRQCTVTYVKVTQGQGRDKKEARGYELSVTQPEW